MEVDDYVLVLVTYDVNTETGEGRRRLRLVAKKCTAYGIRVQHSVFECNIDNAQFHQFRAELEGIINPVMDSLRFYLLGNNYHQKVIHIGANETFDMDNTLIL